MKKRALIIALLAFVASMPTFSQDKNKMSGSKTGWLWEVSGNGHQQKCYLFGTCHGGGHSFTHEDVFGFSGFEEAFSKIQTVYFETDLTVSKRLAAKEMSIAEYLG